MVSSKVLSRLRKLLALSRSGNSHEASSAREKAEALMAKYNIAESDADVVGEDEVVEVPIGAAGFEAPWKFKLATVAARYHDCEALGLRVGKRRKVRLVGVRDNVAAAVELFKTLEREVWRLAKVELSRVVPVVRKLSPRHTRRSSEKYLLYFRIGIVDGLMVLMARTKQEEGRGTRVPDDVTMGMFLSEREDSERVETSTQPVEGLVRVEVRGVRERLVSSGARVVSDEETGDGDFDELDEVAYRSGFRQATAVQMSGERSDS